MYELSGNGAELFSVDNRTGVITLAFCPTPGLAPCLDSEARPDFFLNYKVTITKNRLLHISSFDYFNLSLLAILCILQVSLFGVQLFYIIYNFFNFYFS